ncbi:MAG TPA: CsgG/HfaB family protein [Armatimonadota bacterium]|nr:CsgG/HfaB family protein [Armatimonadota bacterium]
MPTHCAQNPLLIILMMLATLCIAASVSRSADEVAKPLKSRIACLPIQGKDYSGNPGSIVTNAVSAAVAATNRFTLCERKKLDTVFDELKLQGSTGLFDVKTIQDIGKFAGVQDVIFGEIEGVGVQTDTFNAGSRTTYVTQVNYAVDLTVADVATGEILLQFRRDRHDSVDGQHPDLTDVFQRGAREIADEFSQQLIAKVPVVGKVIAVEQGENGFIILDVGANNGVSGALDFQLYVVRDILTSSGRVVQHRDFLCLAKPITINAETTEIIPGEYQTKQNTLGTTLYWVPEAALFATVKEGVEAVSIPCRK